MDEIKNKILDEKVSAMTGSATSAPARTENRTDGRPSGRSRSPYPRKSFSRRDTPRPAVRKADDIIPPIGDSVRIIPLGGVEEVGKNMTVIEYGDDIVIVDMGFQFKDDDTPGVDYILPNTKYLEDRKDKIRGVIITHGHLDHIGGIPYIMDRIGNPPVYTRLLTSILINKRQEEFPHLPPLNLKIVEKEETITLGKMKVEFFTVTHTIPDAMGVMIHTPYGLVVTPGDVKLDHFDGVPTDAEVQDAYGAMYDAMSKPAALAAQVPEPSLDAAIVRYPDCPESCNGHTRLRATTEAPE